MKCKYRVKPGFSAPTPANPGLTYYLEEKRGFRGKWEVLGVFTGPKGKAMATEAMEKFSENQR